jgi:hypothetical protein
MAPAALEQSRGSDCNGGTGVVWPSELPIPRMIFGKFKKGVRESKTLKVCNMYCKSLSVGRQVFKYIVCFLSYFREK